MQTASPRPQVEALVEREVNRVLCIGAFYAALLGFVAAAAIVALTATDQARGLEAPAVWSFFCGLAALGVYLLARAERLRGWIVYPALLAFASLPSALYLPAHFWMPSGAATYITGPPSYLYVFCALVAGLTFRPRLALLASGFGAAQYLGFYFLDREHLDALGGPDPILLQDLTAPPIYFFKALMMIGAGAVVAVVAQTARRLVLRAALEEQEKSAIHRLFGQYVSADARDKIVREQSGLRGEIRSVAVLFCDLRGFSGFSENLAPEEVVAQLNEYLDRMADAISSEQGAIDKFIGDAIMAVFGGVLQLERPCAAAFAAARKMRGILRLLNQERAARGLAPLENGIGLHYGPVLQGPIGSADRKDFTVIGDAVNIASRLEGLCKDYGEGVIVSADFAEQLDAKDRALVRQLGETRVKGRQAPVRIFALAD